MVFSHDMISTIGNHTRQPLQTSLPIVTTYHEIHDDQKCHTQDIAHIEQEIADSRATWTINPPLIVYGMRWLHTPKLEVDHNQFVCKFCLFLKCNEL